jgi:hypothetical protein
VTNLILTILRPVVVPLLVEALREHERTKRKGALSGDWVKHLVDDDFGRQTPRF